MSFNGLTLWATFGLRLSVFLPSSCLQQCPRVSLVIVWGSLRVNLLGHWTCNLWPSAYFSDILSSTFHTHRRHYLWRPSLNFCIQRRIQHPTPDAPSTPPSAIDRPMVQRCVSAEATGAKPMHPAPISLGRLEATNERRGDVCNRFWASHVHRRS